VKKYVDFSLEDHLFTYGSSYWPAHCVSMEPWFQKFLPTAMDGKTNTPGDLVVPETYSPFVFGCKET
jgi:hypothetical protein